MLLKVFRNFTVHRLSFIMQTQERVRTKWVTVTVHRSVHFKSVKLSEALKNKGNSKVTVTVTYLEPWESSKYKFW